jgi:hypothetical protein
MSSADLYGQLRPRAFAVAHRMLGSVSEAEEVVQDAFPADRNVAALRDGSGQPRHELGPLHGGLHKGLLRARSCTPYALNARTSPMAGTTDESRSVRATGAAPERRLRPGGATSTAATSPEGAGPRGLAHFQPTRHCGKVCTGTYGGTPHRQADIVSYWCGR